MELLNAVGNNGIGDGSARKRLEIFEKITLTKSNNKKKGKRS